MSVFDKELTINGKAVRSPEQQVWQNMKDIEELKDIIKPMFKATTSLNSSSTTILISSTNAPDGTKSGWLIDTNGLLFKITGGDETSLLITYYSDLKGPQGEQGESGAEVQIDDNTTAYNKTWSSNKIYSYVPEQVEVAKDKGIFYTLANPTDTGETVGGLEAYTILKSQLGNVYNILPVDGDLIIYIDSNGNPTSIFKYYDIDENNVITMQKLGDYAKGKQLYEHNIRLKFGSNYYELFLQIINDNSNTMFTNLASIVQYLKDNGHTIESGTSDMDTNFLRASGRVQNDAQSVEIKQTEGIYHNKSLENSLYAVGWNDSTSWRDIQITTGINNLTIKEFIKPL